MRKAYSMVELIFVMVIIGILGGIAIPKMTSSVELAHNTSGEDILSSVRMALKMEKQKRIFKGDFTPITSLNTGGMAFDFFSPDKSGKKNRILEYPIPSCSSMGCWEIIDGASVSSDKSSNYIYHYGSSENEICLFKLKDSRFEGHCPTINSYTSEGLNTNED